MVLVATNAGVTGVTDDSGNTYVEAGTLTSSTENLAIWYSVITTALSASDNVTVATPSSYANRIFEVVSILNVTAFDVFASSTSYSATLTATATVSDVSAMAGVASFNSSATVNSGNNATLLTETTQGNKIQTYHNDYSSSGSKTSGINLSAPGGARAWAAFI